MSTVLLVNVRTTVALLLGWANGYHLGVDNGWKDTKF
jgi:hypothetical protein